jgi:hypothetical protein
MPAAPACEINDIAEKPLKQANSIWAALGTKLHAIEALNCRPFVL